MANIPRCITIVTVSLSRAGAEFVYGRLHSIAGEAAAGDFLSGAQTDQNWDEAHAFDLEESGSRGFDDDLYSLLVDGDTEGDHLNFPLLVVRYVLWRLSMASKFCLVCHRRTATGNSSAFGLRKVRLLTQLMSRS